MTAEKHVSDEHWDRFVKDFEVSRTVPAAASRAVGGPATGNGQELGRPKRRRGPRAVLSLVVLAGLVGGYWFGPWHRAGARPVAHASTGATRSSAPAVAAAKAAPRPATSAAALTPEDAYPAAVGDYIKVRQLSLPSCTENPAVQPTLAGLVVQGHGCLGMTFALYADSAKNEYTVAVLTLKDPVDAPSMVTTLSANPTDVQIGTVLPPGSAGLRTMGPDDGAVQQFASVGPYVVIGVASWADGHRSDYQKLEDRLTTVFQAVTKQVGTHALG